VSLKPKQSPHTSVSSEVDIMRFDIDVDVNNLKIQVSDAQSIDSHNMFVMLDKDRSLSMMDNDDDVIQGTERDTSVTSDEGIQMKVRFEGLFILEL